MTLTIQDLGALGEFLGSIAVLATLVYLALQTRQNTMAISAQLDAAAIGANLNSILAGATSTELAEALQEDGSFGDMTTNQTRLAMYWLSMLVIFQWQLQQARRGLLPAFNEVTLTATVRNLFTGSRFFGGFWEDRKRIFSPEFVEWVEEQRAKATGQEA